jgi:hypothetical protein
MNTNNDVLMDNSNIGRNSSPAKLDSSIESPISPFKMDNLQELINTTQPNVEIIQESETRITLQGNFISKSGTDDLEYFIGLRLISASFPFNNKLERRTYQKPKMITCENS